MSFVCGRLSAQLQTPFASSVRGAWMLLGVLLVVGCKAALAARIEAEVVGVTDGDTLIVLDEEKVQHRVRLAGIDAPEKSQPFGSRAQQVLAKAVYRKTVVVDWHKRDRYGRIVGKVLVDNRDACLDLVATGFAWHYKAYEGEQTPEDRHRYATAELAARQQRLGLWADVAPTPPWEFRKQR